MKSAGLAGRWGGIAIPEVVILFIIVFAAFGIHTFIKKYKTV